MGPKWCWNIIFVLTVFVTACRSSPNALRLMDDLFGKNTYNPWVRPIKRDERNLTVHFGAALAEIEDLAEKGGRMSFRIMLAMWWRDYQLSWDPVEYGRLSKIYLPAEKIWTPDVDLYNGIENEANRDIRIQVFSNGDVLWQLPAHYKSTCVHEFRSDTWHCPLHFRSWTQDGSELDLVPFEGNSDLNMDELFTSTHWVVLSGKGERVLKQYPCCETPFPTMEYKMIIRNKIGHPALMGRRSVRSRS